ncbi:hypothetical protein AOLI_G00023030 [Acnodon oligacanthus]
MLMKTTNNHFQFYFQLLILSVSQRSPLLLTKWTLNGLLFILERRKQHREFHRPIQELELHENFRMQLR